MKSCLFIFLSSLCLVSCNKRDRPIPTPPPTNPPTSYIGEADSNNSIYSNGKKAFTKGAVQQGEDEKDRLITQNIRKSLINDRSLSIRAKNITVITEDGIVTLRGFVATPKERDQITEKVTSIPGVSKLNNKLEVSSN